MDKGTLRDYELEIIVKAWRDEVFRKKLMAEPKKAIEDEFDIIIPDEIKVNVHEEDEHNIHLIIPSVPSKFDSQGISDDELKLIIGGVMSTGHLSGFPSSKERSIIREIKKENIQQKKMIDQLKKNLSDMENLFLKKKN